jgi:hypothetical protein
MSMQLRPLGIIAFVSAFVTLGFGVSAPATIAFAVDCLSAPNSPAPSNSHWYYRTDRLQERKCWHLRSDNGALGQEAAQTEPVRSGSPYPGQGDLVAQHGGAKPSGQDVEQLYAAFLEWKRRTKN